MDALFEALPLAAAKFGRTLAQLTYERGLAVTAKDGSTRAIPVTATPVVLAEAELRRRARVAAVLASAGAKMAHAVLAGPQAGLLLGGLSPLERSIAERTFPSALRLATTRVDFFVSGGRPMALELNATIPAMQGYSDIAAHAFIEVVGRHAGLDAPAISQLVARNGSNARALFDALLAAYRQDCGRPPERIALLCRRHDAQLTEQRYLCDRFRAFGVDADVVHPDELSGERELKARGKRYDLVYRHLFVRRLEEPDVGGAAYVTDLLAGGGHDRAVVLNPPASQVEVKTAFALLSEAVAEPTWASAAKLTAAELEAIREAVPWTRRFVGGSTLGPGGEPLRDLVEAVAAAPDRYVLKRAWDYGGRTVFVGKSRHEPSFAERVRTTYGAQLDWPDVCRKASQDLAGGGFVVQALVPTRPERHLLCSDQGVAEAELYVDFSAYASVGIDQEPAWGGVCRGSTSQIVNIVGGGGVLPLLVEEVAVELGKALARS